MTPGRWLLTTISMVLIASLATGGLNMMVDVYGLYRPARRQLPVYGDARVAKELLNLRYVPENFNALMTGASFSANWDVTAIEKLHVYNDSLNGGNIIEEKALIEAATQRPGISVVFLAVHPALTHDHDFHAVDMTPDLQRSAVGSLSLWDAYKEMLKIRFGRSPRTFDYAGTETFFDLPSEMNAFMREMWEEPEFKVDPIALQAYRDLVAELRARRIQIIFVVPPTSEQLLRTKRVALEHYVQRMQSEIGPGDLWIDFLADDRSGVSQNQANFSDGVHLVPSGTRQVVGQINLAVNQWIADRRLVVAR
jgi:hypothetical protein